MSNTFSTYHPSQLPAGFFYPNQFLDFAKSGLHPVIGPWWFIDAVSKAGKLAYAIREHDGRNLVPFAKVDDGRDDIACFDGEDTSGNPQVLMLILDKSGRAYSYRDFSNWLASAQADALR